MPRFVVNVGDGETAEVGGLRVRALLIRGKGRRLRVIIDVPPEWPNPSTRPSRPIRIAPSAPADPPSEAIRADDAA